jgi:glycosyltransferase involved in cell wall biosynthesis
MLISVITVTYNSIKTIKETVLSVVNQSYPPHEYIIVDSYSTDGTSSFLKDIAQRYGFVKLYSDERKGVYEALNFALDKSEGDLIGIIHSGSTYALDAIKHVSIISTEYSTRNILPILAGSVKWNSDTKKNVELRSCMINISTKNTKLLHESLFIPSQFYKKYGLYSTEFRICSDLDFVYKCISSNNSPIVYTDHILLSYNEDWGMSEKHNVLKLKEQIKILSRYNSPVYAFLQLVVRSSKLFIKKTISFAR